MLWGIFTGPRPQLPLLSQTLLPSLPRGSFPMLCTGDSDPPPLLLSLPTHQNSSVVPRQRKHIPGVGLGTYPGPPRPHSSIGPLSALLDLPHSVLLQHGRTRPLSAPTALPALQTDLSLGLLAGCQRVLPDLGLSLPHALRVAHCFRSPRELAVQQGASAPDCHLQLPDFPHWQRGPGQFFDLLAGPLQNRTG